MSKSINVVIAFILLSFTACNAQIKNAKTVTAKIYGNCEMCKKTIEKAGNSKNLVKVDWNKDTKTTSVTFDSIKTNPAEILKRIALAGYDSDQFLAPDEVYAKLPECCQYDRVKKTISKKEAVETTQDHSQHQRAEDHSGHKEISKKQIETNQLQAVFDTYFVLKDALVKADGNAASVKATDLDKALKTVKMETLTQEEHSVWMKVMKELLFDAEHISETKDVSHQRDHFTTLSDNIYKLLKVSKQKVPVYYQHCPMYNDGKGANWLSKESTIKNPYYGSQMLSCGKTTETIR